jgi:glutamyl-Q tRNA(Asp) synthetase
MVLHLCPKQNINGSMQNITTDQGSIITRFAPSPSGYLHLGHAYSAWFAERFAKEAEGKFLLRIENIDQNRCRQEYEVAIVKDLTWLGLNWEKPIRRQSNHMAEYSNGLAKLSDMDLIYPCFCTRKEIRQEIERINAAPHEGIKDKRGPIYPGTCRVINLDDRKRKISMGYSYALRLNTRKAVHLALQKRKYLSWSDKDLGLQSATPEIFGDVVLARKDEPTSYHLSVVVDDAAQGVNFITRGEDLRDVTHIHCLLQALLDFECPNYCFHPVLVDKTGKRLAKRDGSITIHELRKEGKTVAEIRRMVGLN